VTLLDRSRHTLFTVLESFQHEFEFGFRLLLYAHRHRGILGAAGHIILTPANQLIVMGLKIWSLSNPGFGTATFDYWPNALTICANRATSQHETL
jgi:hypothetical protein